MALWAACCWEAVRPGADEADGVAPEPPEPDPLAFEVVERWCRGLWSLDRERPVFDAVAPDLLAVALVDDELPEPELFTLEIAVDD